MATIHTLLSDLEHCMKTSSNCSGYKVDKWLKTLMENGRECWDQQTLKRSLSIISRTKNNLAIRTKTLSSFEEYINNIIDCNNINTIYDFID